MLSAPRNKLQHLRLHPPQHSNQQPSNPSRAAVQCNLPCWETDLQGTSDRSEQGSLLIAMLLLVLLP